MTDDYKYKTTARAPQTEFKIRDTGEIEFKGEPTPEILTQVLDESSTRHRRYIELEKQRNAENQIIGIVCIIAGFFVFFTITFGVVQGIKTIFLTPTQEIH